MSNISSNPALLRRSLSLLLLSLLASTVFAGSPQLGALVAPSGVAHAGTMVTFTMTVGDPDGTGDLLFQQLLINDHLGGTGACYLMYDRTSSSVVLGYSNPGYNGWLVAGSAETASNDQCTLYAAGSRVVPTTINVGGISMPAISVTWQVSFRHEFAGNKSMYVLACDMASTCWGWDNRGSLQVNRPPQAHGVTPLDQSGTAQRFGVVVMDADGINDVGFVQLLINDRLTGEPACYVSWDRISNRMDLQYPTSGGSVTPGAGGTASNNQCTLHGTGSRAETASGTSGTWWIDFNLSFHPAFAGNKKVWVGLSDMWGSWSGWDPIRTTYVVKGTATPIAVSLKTIPNPVVNSGGSVPLWATVANTTNPAVTYDVIPAIGSVVNDRYLAGTVATEQTVAILAKSVQQPSSIAQTAIIVKPGGGTTPQRGGTNFYLFASPGHSLGNPNPSGSTVVSNYSSPAGFRQSHPSCGGYLSDYLYKPEFGTPGYHVTSARMCIDAELHEMYGMAQRRLRIPIYHFRGASDCTASTFLDQMDSAGGTLPVRCRENLAGLLSTIQAIGYEGVVIGFFPSGFNQPTDWNQEAGDAWNNKLTYAEENYNVIKTVREIVLASGVPYTLDLINEGAPPGGPYRNDANGRLTSEAIHDREPNRWTLMAEYARYIWGRYAEEFGTADTVGASIPCDYSCGLRIDNLLTLYGVSGKYPAKFSLHIYRPPVADLSVTAAYNAARGRLLANPNTADKPWIIGEACFNDFSQSEELWAADQYNRHIEYLLQWPLNCATRQDVWFDPTNYRFDGYWNRW